MQAHTIQIFMISILGLVLLQLSYAQTISMDNPGCPCTNKEPPGEFSCDQQKQYKKCTAEWMISGDFCAITCGRCVCVQEEDLADRQVGEDLPAELLANGDTETSEGGDDKVCECTDVPPPNPWEYTCEQQKDFGKCTESFMIDKNFCQITCGRCPCTPEELEEAMLSNSTEVLQATEDISALSAFVVGGTPSSTPVSTSDSPMDDPVQDTEDQLLEIMDMLQHSTLLLDDTKKQGKGRRKGGKGNQKEEKAPATEEQEEGAYTLPLQNQVLDLPAIIAGSDAASPPLQEVEQVQPFALPEYNTPIMSPVTESVYTQDVQEPYLYEPDLVSQSSLVAPPPPPQMTYITPITVDDGVDAGYYDLGADVTQSPPLPDVVGDIQQPEPSGQLPVGVAYDAYDLNSDSLPGQTYSSYTEEPLPEGVTLPPGFNLGSGAQPMLLPPDEVVDVYSQDVSNPSSSTYEETDSDVPQAMATLADEMPFDSQAAMDNYLYGVSIDPAQNVIGEPEQEVSSQGAVAPFELPELVQGSYAGLQQIYQPEPEAEVPTRPLSIDIPLQNPAPEPEAGESTQSAILGPILSMSVPEEPFKELSIEPSQDAEEVAVTPLVLPSPLPSALTLTPTLEELPSLTKPSLVPVPEPEQQSGMQGVASVDSIEIPKQSGLMDMPVISATIDDDEDEDNGVVIMSPVEEAKEKPVKDAAGDEQLSSTLGLEGEGEPGSAECFFSALSTVADLSLLMTIIENAGPSFAQLLIPEGETVTFLAPANEAFTSLMFKYDITFEQLMEAQPEILMGLFSYHFVEGDVTIEYMEETGALTSLLGQMVFVETGSSDSISGVKISGYLGEEAEILNAEMRACGIMVHVIDTLLMPDGMESTLLGVLDVPETPAATATAPVPKQQACQNITLLELLSQQENAETMSTALYQLEQSGADLLLTGDVPYTMFVPTNDVFASTLNELIAMNSPLVTSTGSSVEENLLLYHIIQGQKLTLEDLLELPVVSTMYSGAEISLNSANDQLLLQGIGNEARIITSDIGNACNVVVHLINSVLLPQIPNVPAVSIVPQTGYGDQEGQAGLDVQPSDITFDQIVPYLPTGAVSDQQYQKQPATSEVPLESCKTIGEVIESVTDLSIMGLSLIDAGFGELLSDIQLEVTVLAPTNEAFGNFMRDLGVPLDSIKQDSELLKIYMDSLAMHILQQPIRFEDLVQPMEVNSYANNSKGFPEVVSFRPVFPNTVKVISPEAEGNIVGSALRACKSYIYPIDSFLLVRPIVAPSPQLPGIQQAQSSDAAELVREPGNSSAAVDIPSNGQCLTVEQVILTDPRMASFQMLLSRAGLLDIIGSTSNITVFAPMNDGMSVILRALYDDVVQLSGDTLQVWSGYHIVQGKWTQKSLTKGLLLNTLAGGANGPLQLEVDISPGKGSGKVVNIKGLSNDASIQEADIPACDAIIHIVDGPLLPVSRST